MGSIYSEFFGHKLLFIDKNITKAEALLIKIFQLQFFLFLCFFLFLIFPLIPSYFMLTYELERKIKNYIWIMLELPKKAIEEKKRINERFTLESCNKSAKINLLCALRSEIATCQSCTRENCISWGKTSDTVNDSDSRIHFTLCQHQHFWIY